MALSEDDKNDVKLTVIKGIKEAFKELPCKDIDSPQNPISRLNSIEKDIAWVKRIGGFFVGLFSTAVALVVKKLLNGG